MARTTHRSSKGTKLYAVRDAEGQFRDIQTYKRAHAMDIKRTSKAKLEADEKAAAKKKTARTPAKKTAAKSTTKVAKSATRKAAPKRAAASTMKSAAKARAKK